MKTILIALSIALFCLPVSATTLYGGAEDDNCYWQAYEQGWPEPQGLGWGWVTVYDHCGNSQYKEWRIYNARQRAIAIAKGVSIAIPLNRHPKTWEEIQESGGLTPLKNTKCPVKDVAYVQAHGRLPDR